MFYRIIDFLSEHHLPHDAGDFRLIDRVIINQLVSIGRQQPYLRGAIASFGFKQTGLPYDRKSRQYGRSKFNLSKLFGLALDGILSHSLVPLRIAIFVGLVVSVLASFGAAYYLFVKLFLPNDWPVGLASSSILILFSIGLNATFLGIIGEYIGRIYKETLKFPPVIIDHVIDHSANRGKPLQPSPFVARTEKMNPGMHAPKLDDDKANVAFNAFTEPSGTDGSHTQD